MPDKHWQITVLFLCVCCEKSRPETTVTVGIRTGQLTAFDAVFIVARVRLFS